MLTATATLSKTGVFLTAGWHHLVLLNFTIDPNVLEPHVPAGTELDTWEGQTYVSVVGFQFLDTNVLGIPALFHRRFEEVNLRFYVVRHTRDGPRRGVVFLREICPKPLVSSIARWCYNEKYVTMPMRHRVVTPSRQADGFFQYEWYHAERWQGLSARVHGEAAPLVTGSKEEFILEHYWGYSRQPDGGTIEYQVEHPPWGIWQASAPTYDCDVARIYGDAFAPYLHEPASVIVADGSPVVVRRGLRLA
jgi:uncharacterized protein YqjF (DUF2071 family)